MLRRRIELFGVAIALLGGCATLPTGPSVTVLPAPGKPFEQFQAEDSTCRQWAAQQLGGAPGAPATQNTAVGAVVGTAVGAGLGALFGGAAGHAGTGAAIGAGAGLLGGTAVGANADQASAWSAQRRYDAAYQQCMYVKGNQVPGVVQGNHRWPTAAPSPPPPPPPPGYSPAPPGPPPPPPSYPPGPLPPPAS